MGREPERAVLDRMLSGRADAPLVAYLHGPGGIGKSSLLRYAARQAELTGRRVVRVDGRFLDADPRRFEQAAAPACAKPGAVLLIDTFEQCQPLEAWLRETFLPRLADDAIVILASKDRPRRRMVTGPRVGAGVHRAARASAGRRPLPRPARRPGSAR
ncbi:AAA family ATPase [Streptomyces sp. NPDC094149]|uniref:AAA family ATPase n=1 Tax=Streptomyces sp. NPDC094149 TaxID=3155079 RepID=UPI00333375FB